MARERLDKLLVDRGLVASRERARALVMTGAVLVRGQPETKPGTLLDPSVEITLREADHPYVSRGALKLVKGLDAFGIDPAGKVALDIGASTGGFTDVLLRRGATRVYAIDVGYGQLAWSLRQDPRVVVLERTNVRNMDLALVPEECDLAVIDVSFISLTLVLPRVAELLSPVPRVAAPLSPVPLSPVPRVAAPLSPVAHAAEASSAPRAGEPEVPRVAAPLSPVAHAAEASSVPRAGEPEVPRVAAPLSPVAHAAEASSVPRAGEPEVPRALDATTPGGGPAELTVGADAPRIRPPAGKPIICLVKPQFEVGRDQVGKGGVVRDEAARRGAVDKIRQWANANGFVAGEDVESPITGPAGNVEYLLLLRTA